MTEHKDETEIELKRVLHEMTIELTEYGGTTASATAEVVCEERPDLERQYGFEHIEAVAKQMMKSDLPQMSDQFQTNFRDFNMDYFCGRLPDYAVKVMYDAGWSFAPYPQPLAASINKRQRIIRLLVSSNEELMVQMLLHFMAHAATTLTHSIRWTSEMIRLRDICAPIDPDHIWATGGQVWRIIEKAQVGQPNEDMGVSEEQRLIALGCSQKELELLTALHMIGPNRDTYVIEEVVRAREKQRRERLRKGRKTATTSTRGGAEESGHQGVA